MVVVREVVVLQREESIPLCQSFHGTIPFFSRFCECPSTMTSVTRQDQDHFFTMTETRQKQQIELYALNIPHKWRTYIQNSIFTINEHASYSKNNNSRCFCDSIWKSRCFCDSLRQEYSRSHERVDVGGNRHQLCHHLNKQRVFVQVWNWIVCASVSIKSGN